MEVYDLNGVPQILGKKMGRGGEAEIYYVELGDRNGRPNVLFKRYHDNVLESRREILQNKVKILMEINREHAMEQSLGIEWLSIPILDVYDSSDEQNRKWIGYCMYEATGTKLSNLAHPSIYARYFPNLNRVKVLDYLINFLKCIKKLHKNDIKLGDYNVHNILLNPNSNQVFLIDCDSYQIKYKEEFYPCEVGSADMTPKEHQNKAFKDVIRTIESEKFSIAIILFKVLMFGKHPYDIVGGSSPVENLHNAIFPYDKQAEPNSRIPKGIWFKMWSELPDEIKDCFIRTFTKGAEIGTERTSISTWIKKLQAYKQQIENGQYSNNIFPKK